MKKEDPLQAPRKRRRPLRILLAVLLILAVGTAIYAADYYRADDSVRALLAEGVPGVSIRQETGRLIFEPASPRAGLVFYPGGKVEYTAYAPLMAELSKEGILCVLLKMPLNLAVLNMGAAAGIPEEFPAVRFWILAGHSLGGAMAASFMGKNPKAFDALVLLAAYSTADLTDSGLQVLTLTGSKDGVINREKAEKYAPNLPAGTQNIVIEGGCHAFFGAYGNQKGDGEPSISPKEQIRQSVQAILSLLPEP